MDIRYAILTSTGINDPSGTLKGAYADVPNVCDTFADAKAELIARANALHEYLVSTGRNYAMHVDSRAEHFEVTFEYGPASSEPALPFRMVLKVSPCTPRQGRLDPLNSEDIVKAVRRQLALPHRHTWYRRSACATSNDASPLIFVAGQRTRIHARCGRSPMSA